MSSTERKYFGTDGIRGTVGEPPITPDFVMKLGWAAGRVLGARAPGRQKVLIGKDTRVSGYMFESALEAGLSAAGIDIHLLGRCRPRDCLSHAHVPRRGRHRHQCVAQPFDDNGIKFFSHAGTKLPDDIELEIEAELAKPLATVASRDLGKARRVEDAAGRHIEFCKARCAPPEPGRPQAGRRLRAWRDLSRGARGVSELGAEVVTLGANPDGFNINEACGATARRRCRPRCANTAPTSVSRSMGTAIV